MHQHPHCSIREQLGSKLPPLAVGGLQMGRDLGVKLEMLDTDPSIIHMAFIVLRGILVIAF